METRMIYRLLGELEISRGGPLLDLPGGPTLVVLAALLVNVNRRMSKTELIRAAWGNDEVSEAQLYKGVMAVRDLLTKIGREPGNSSRIAASGGAGGLRCLGPPDAVQPEAAGTLVEHG
jgi:DNA-binding SARP family transcriptional activator